MIKRTITLLMISITYLLAQEDFLEGVRAEDLTLDRIVAPSVEDTIGIRDWSKFFFNTSKVQMNPNGNLSVEFWSDGIWVTDLKTNQRKKIDERGVTPKWSPDGRLIAFTKQKILPGKKSVRGLQLYGEDELWICKPDGTNKKKLTNHTHVELYIWDPAGRYIYFGGLDSTGRRNEPFYLGRVDITTGKKEIIDTGSPYNEICFSLSPDGRMIAYCKPLKWELKTEWWVTDAEIFIANVDGTGKTQITETEVVETMVKWSDDGKSLIVRQFGPDPSDFSFPEYVKIILKKK